MNELFLNIINMSISASWLVLTVLLLRFVLKKAPKWVSVLLWGIVAVRLVCPLSIESAWSLIPSPETFPEKVLSGPSFDVQTGIAPVDIRINDYLGDHYFEGVTVPANNGSNVMTVLTIVWGIGILLLFAYTAISYLRLRHKVDTAVLYRGSIFQSENVASPFVLGIIKPRIYLPFQMNGQEMEHVVAHEQAHIRRKDHWWKPLGFLLLTIHWFNPLMWLAYVLLCRDIELACDEKVIKDLGSEQRADYTQALVACSVNRRMIAACPLAFGEVDVKERVKSVMNYKKPAFWIVVLAVILCVVVAVCFLTNPMREPLYTRSDNDIDKIQSIDIEHGSVSYKNTSTSSFDYVLEFLSEIKISRSPISQNRSEDRDKTNVIAIQFTNQTYTYYYFSKDFSSVWINDSVKPSLSRSVHSPELVKQFFESQIETSISAVGGIDEPTDVLNQTKQDLSLNDVIILSQNGYDLTWSDFEGYDYIETGSGLYIRVYEINELFSLWIGGSGPDSDPMYIYLALADDIDTRIDIRDGGVTEFISKHNSGSAEKWALIPMVMVNGTLYLDTGHESTLARCGVMDGEITSQVDETEKPSVNDQSNFGTGYGYQYGAAEGTIEILMNGKWRIFATEDVRQEIQFPSTDDAHNEYYLTIGAEGVKRIELLMPNGSGGCQNADGSLFKKGKRIRLEHLDGYADLRGLVITALNEKGEVVWSASVPNTGENKDFTRLTNDGWTITNIE